MKSNYTYVYMCVFDPIIFLRIVDDDKSDSDPTKFTTQHILIVVAWESNMDAQGEQDSPFRYKQNQSHISCQGWYKAPLLLLHSFRKLPQKK